MQRRSIGLTDVGKKRTSNEDAFFFNDELGLYAIADGMGGHAAGEIASQESLDTVVGMVRRGYESIKKLEDGELDENVLKKAIRLLESSVQAATYLVYALAEHEPERKGMGTTLSALMLIGNTGITAQVGDSRIYLVRDGKVYRLTEDHTLIAWQIKQGLISEKDAAKSPHKNVITRAVGSRDYVQVDTRCFEIVTGDAFLLCSDGLHGYLQDDEIPAILAEPRDKACKKLIDLANERGGRDNISVVVVDVTG